MGDKCGLVLADASYCSDDNLEYLSQSALDLGRITFDFFNRFL